MHPLSVSELCRKITYSISVGQKQENALSRNTKLQQPVNGRVRTASRTDGEEFPPVQRNQQHHPQLSREAKLSVKRAKRSARDVGMLADIISIHHSRIGRQHHELTCETKEKITSE